MENPFRMDRNNSFGSNVQPATAGYTGSAQTVFGKFERCDIRNQGREHLEVGLIEISQRPKICTTTKNHLNMASCLFDNQRLVMQRLGDICLSQHAHTQQVRWCVRTRH